MFRIREHRSQLAFSGDPDIALDVAKTALLGQGFAIVRASPGRIDARGPGLRSTNQPTLHGVSEISVTVTRESVHAEARLGGARWIKVFTHVFPPALALILSLPLAPSLGFSWTPFLAVAPWLVVGPPIAAAVERRTIAAVDDLVRSMVVVGGEAATGGHSS